MSVRSLSLFAIALCLAVGVSFSLASVECDAERGICRKPGAAAPAPAPAAVEEEVAPAAVEDEVAPAVPDAAAPAADAAPSAGCPKGGGHGRGKAAGAGSGCGKCAKAAGSGCGGCGRHGAGQGRGAGHGRGAGAHQPPDRETIHGLLGAHAKIQRSVEEIDGGIVADTTSQDPAVTAMIRKHVAEMKTRLEQGEPVRMWDPLFAALFEHHDEIALSIVEIEGGVRVTETSKNPEVVALIRQHANRAVSEFAAEGFGRVHEVTPLPGGSEKGAAAAAGAAKGASRP